MFVVNKTKIFVFTLFYGVNLHSNSHSHMYVTQPIYSSYINYAAREAQTIFITCRCKLTTKFNKKNNIKDGNSSGSDGGGGKYDTGIQKKDFSITTHKH